MKNTQVLMLHGWAESVQQDKNWSDFRRHLAQLGVRSTLLKLPGLSTSLKRVWSLDDYVDWVVSSLPTGQAITLLGHSFGGQVSIRLTARHSELVSSLILIDSAGIRDMSLPARVKRRVFWTAAKLGKKILPFAFARRVLYFAAREKDYYQADPVLAQTMIKVINQEVRQDAVRIKTPTLIVWGRRDKITPLWMGKTYAQLIKQARFEIVESARHAPHFSHPEQVAYLVAGFLDQSL